jgi:hypothetical protein
MMQSCANEDARIFPPTELYNEGWMLRLCLDWFARTGDGARTHPLSVPPGCRWYSEALLATQFKPSNREEGLGEGYTHADGVIGQFSFDGSGKGDIRLLPHATRFTVVEAKICSKLSTGTTHAPHYDQAARNVACMAEVLRLSGTPVEQFNSLGFVVLVPKNHPDMADFKSKVTADSIRDRVQARVVQYEDESRYKKMGWFEDVFLPTLAKIRPVVVTWEAVLRTISRVDRESHDELASFYRACLKFNMRRTPGK